jgi:hypothetical protein
MDAEVSAPDVCITLTTRDPDLPARVYRDGSAVLFRRLRRRFGRVDYFGAIEFTTGRGSRSGGLRRLHGHYLTKGLGAVDPLEVEHLTRDTWRETTGAFVVEVAHLVTPGAALGYLGLHHRKPEQAPPAEWRGMTERASRGYFHRPVAELRAAARFELAAEAHAYATGLPLELARIEVANREPAELVEVRDGLVIEPVGILSTGRSELVQRGGVVFSRSTGEIVFDGRA